MFFVLFRLEQAGAHDGERFGAVFDLRALVGAVNGDAGRLVHHHDGGVGRIDVLPPCPAGAHGGNVEVLWVDHDINFFGFG